MIQSLDSRDKIFQRPPGVSLVMFELYLLPKLICYNLNPKYLRMTLLGSRIIIDVISEDEVINVGSNLIWLLFL